MRFIPLLVSSELIVLLYHDLIVQLGSLILGLVLDGMPTYQNLSNVMPDLGMFQVYPDPEIQRWEDTVIVTENDPSFKIEVFLMQGTTQILLAKIKRVPFNF